ncbi:hypothetical protein [Calidifontibacillus oryziterrae]|uniref:hypothetical protein n=1 Tax=Calidifontibacillus oryziterrae TaxID=1191699 RepID=UPI00031F3B5F|nr:hypothetical protein [Calidifontibacillus oryziterrae]
MAGIQIHSHDILDEGSHQILQYINKLKDVDYIFPQVNSIFERNPNPIGILPRNRKNPVVSGNGKLFLPIHVKDICSDLYQDIDLSIMNGRDPLLELKQCVNKQQYKVVPWFSILNGDFKGSIEDHCITTYDGEKVLDWLCPNSPVISEMWSNVLIETKKMYGYSVHMLDRIRYPDWSGETIKPKLLFTCFCPHCQKKMIEKGMDIELLTDTFEKVKQYLTNKNFHEAVLLLKESNHFQDWYLFRQESVTSLIQSIIDRINQKGEKLNLWLDLWPPSYSWFLGQDYSQLTSLVPLLKHFPYHKLGGGADVQGLIRYFTSDPDEEEKAFQAFLRLFGFSYKLSFTDFKNKGFPIKFVHDENKQVRKLSQPNTKIYSGIQMWNIENEDLINAIKEAKNSQADDIIYYCYGWAEDSHFETVSSINR